MQGDEVILDVTFVPSSGRSQRARRHGLEAKDLDQFAASTETRSAAVSALQALGFRIVGPASPFGVTIAGPPSLVETVFGPGEPVVPPPLSTWVEAVTRPPPVRFY